jgi:hypothetical protein
MEHRRFAGDPPGPPWPSGAAERGAHASPTRLSRRAPPTAGPGAWPERLPREKRASSTWGTCWAPRKGPLRLARSPLYSRRRMPASRGHTPRGAHQRALWRGRRARDASEQREHNLANWTSAEARHPHPPREQLSPWAGALGIAGGL